MRAVVFAVVLAAGVAAQTVEDVVPRGMKLDDAGKLQWVEIEMPTCTVCAGDRVVTCHRCDGKECVLCSGGKLPCPPCGATGVAMNPFVEVMCPQCNGVQREQCPACLGDRIRLNAIGEERQCEGCAGAGAFACPLCAGTGRLAMAKIDGTDVRRASIADLRERYQRLRAARRLLDGRDRGRGDHEAELAEHIEALGEMRDVLELPDGQAVRLRARIDAAKAADNPELVASMNVGYHRFALEQYVEAQLHVVEMAKWRLGRNEPDDEPPEPAIKASAIQWAGLFGGGPATPQSAYCLLGAGFFRSPTSDDIDQVIAGWLQAHPDAVLRPVSRSISDRPVPGSHWVYTWIVDGDERLDLHLVEKGCISAGTLWAPTPMIEIPFAEYADVLHRANEAEKRARAAERGRWAASPDPQRHVDAAEKLMEKGDHAGALVEFRAAIAAGGARSRMWLDVGECHERLEQWGQALAAYDMALDDSIWWMTYARRAECLRRAEGLDEAVRWLESLAKDDPTSHRYPYLLGDLLRKLGLLQRALPRFERAVELASAKHGFRFGDDGWLLLTEETLAKEKQDFADLSKSLDRLAEGYLQTRRYDTAMRCATMRVAIGQQVHRCEGYYNDAEVEAGDVDGRIVRARVLMHRKEWRAAEIEIGRAHVLAARHGYTVETGAVAKARADLAADRGK